MLILYFQRPQKLFWICLLSGIDPCFILSELNENSGTGATVSHISWHPDAPMSSSHCPTIACLKGILWKYGLSSFHGRYTQIRSMFGQKSTYSLRKCLYFVNRQISKMKDHFRKKCVLKLRLSMNMNNKNRTHKLIFLNIKKYIQIRMILDIEIFLWISGFGFSEMQ